MTETLPSKKTKLLKSYTFKLILDEFREPTDNGCMKSKTLTNSCLSYVLLALSLIVTSCNSSIKLENETRKNQAESNKIHSFDLSEKNSSNSSMKVQYFAGDDYLGLSEVQAMTTDNSFSLVSDNIADIEYDSANNLLYVAYFSYGVTSRMIDIFDTNGTEDISDDIRVGYYDHLTTPSLPGERVYDIEFDELSGTLYIATYTAGVYAINTQGNSDPSDDLLEHNFLNGTVPGLGHVNNQARDVQVGSDGLLVISQYGGGVSLIDTKGTATISDDVEIINYKTSTAPAISNNATWASSYDETSGLIFVASNIGVDIIDTALTPFDASDDTLVGSYSSATSPGLICDRSVDIDYRSTTGLLYVTCDAWGVGDNTGLVIIDTKKTATTADDSLYARYGMLTELGYSNNQRLQNMAVSENGEKITLTTFEDVIEIDTKGTQATGDDSVEKFVDSGKISGIFSNSAKYISELNTLFVSGYLGIAVLTDNFQNLTADYVFAPVSSSEWENGAKIGWSSDLQNLGSLTLSARTASTTFEFDLDNGDVSDISDFYGWGSIFPTISETDGVLTLTGSPSNAVWAAFWFDTGEADDYYPAGSTIEVRLKVTTAATNYQDCLFVDDWESLDTCFVATGDWQTIKLTASSSFSKVGLEPWWDSGTWSATDKIEIDYVKIVHPSDWTAWQPLTKNSANTSFSQNLEEFFQVKVDFSTPSASNLPTLRSLYIYK